MFLAASTGCLPLPTFSAGVGYSRVLNSAASVQGLLNASQENQVIASSRPQSYIEGRPLQEDNTSSNPSPTSPTSDGVETTDDTLASVSENTSPMIAAPRTTEEHTGVFGVKEKAGVAVDTRVDDNLGRKEAVTHWMSNDTVSQSFFPDSFQLAQRSDEAVCFSKAEELSNSNASASPNINLDSLSPENRCNSSRCEASQPLRSPESRPFRTTVQPPQSTTSPRTPTALSSCCYGMEKGCAVEQSVHALKSNDSLTSSSALLPFFQKIVSGSGPNSFFSSTLYGEEPQVCQEGPEDKSNGDSLNVATLLAYIVDQQVAHRAILHRLQQEVIDLRRVWIQSAAGKRHQALKLCRAHEVSVVHCEKKISLYENPTSLEDEQLDLSTRSCHQSEIRLGSTAGTFCPVNASNVFSDDTMKGQLLSGSECQISACCSTQIPTVSSKSSISDGEKTSKLESNYYYAVRIAPSEAKRESQTENDADMVSYSTSATERPQQQRQQSSACIWPASSHNPHNSINRGCSNYSRDQHKDAAQGKNRSLTTEETPSHSSSCVNQCSGSEDLLTDYVSQYVSSSSDTCPSHLTDLPSGVWYDRVENRYVVQCNETTACGRKKRKYFGVSRYGRERARQFAISARLHILGARHHQKYSSSVSGDVATEALHSPKKRLDKTLNRKRISSSTPSSSSLSLSLPSSCYTECPTTLLKENQFLRIFEASHHNLTEAAPHPLTDAENERGACWPANEVISTFNNETQQFPKGEWLPLRGAPSETARSLPQSECQTQQGSLLSSCGQESCSGDPTRSSLEPFSPCHASEASPHSISSTRRETVCDTEDIPEGRHEASVGVSRRQPLCATPWVVTPSLPPPTAPATRSLCNSVSLKTCIEQASSESLASSSTSLMSSQETNTWVQPDPAALLMDDTKSTVASNPFPTPHHTAEEHTNPTALLNALVAMLLLGAKETGGADSTPSASVGFFNCNSDAEKSDSHTPKPSGFEKNALQEYGVEARQTHETSYVILESPDQNSTTAHNDNSTNLVKEEPVAVDALQEETHNELNQENRACVKTPEHFTLGYVGNSPKKLKTPSQIHTGSDEKIDQLSSSLASLALIDSYPDLLAQFQNKPNCFTTSTDSSSVSQSAAMEAKKDQQMIEDAASITSGLPMLILDIAKQLSDSCSGTSAYTLHSNKELNGASPDRSAAEGAPISSRSDSPTDVLHPPNMAVTAGRHRGVNWLSQSNVWRARWVDGAGREISRCFSVEKFGWHEAKRLAIEARRQAEISGKAYRNGQPVKFRMSDLVTAPP